MQGNLERRIHRLFEDETLTGDIDDAPARALLEWAVERLREGRDEAAVRRLVRTLVRLVRDRAQLNPGQVQKQLEGPVAAPWPAEKQALLTALVAERESLPAIAWAQRLLRLVSTNLPAPAEQPEQSLAQSEASASPPTQPGSPKTPEGHPLPPASPRWWQRIVPWRRRP
jgi:hypothetical protein